MLLLLHLPTKSSDASIRCGWCCLILPKALSETALSCFGGNAETTVSKSVNADESAWPAALQVMDRTLPRRRHDKNAVTVAQKEAEAGRIVKTALQAAQRQEEKEAVMVDAVVRTENTTRDEYNDDYDDQYEDLDGEGNPDTGLYDDYDAVQAYNRVVKEVGTEQSFWEENRNLNRQNKKKTRPRKRFTVAKSRIMDRIRCEVEGFLGEAAGVDGATEAVDKEVRAVTVATKARKRAAVTILTSQIFAPRHANWTNVAVSKRKPK